MLIASDDSKNIFLYQKHGCCTLQEIPKQEFQNKQAEGITNLFIYSTERGNFHYLVTPQGSEIIGRYKQIQSIEELPQGWQICGEI